MAATRATREAALVALLGATLFVALMTFSLSFAGNDGYGRDVARVGRLSPLVPLGIDGLTVTAIAATFLLRHAPWRVRAYAWSVFVFSCLGSIAGNLSHADHLHLDIQGMIGAAAWPTMLASASHLTIVTLRSLDRLRSVPPEPVTPPVVREPEPVAAQPVPTLPAARIVSVPAILPANRRGNWDRGTALRRLVAGESCAAIAADLGVSKKTIERFRSDRQDEIDSGGELS